MRIERLEKRLAAMPAESEELKLASADELGIRLGSHDPVDAYHAARELLSRGPSGRAALVELLGSSSVRERDAAAAALAFGGGTPTGEEALALVGAHSAAAGAGQRALLAAALGRAGAAESTDALLADLEHPSRRVRAAAITALARSGSPLAGGALLRLAVSDDPVAPLAADAFAALDEAAVVMVEGEWTSLDPRQRRKAIGVIGRRPGAGAADLLIAHLDDPSPLVALAAALELARRGDETGVGLAQSRLSSDDPAVRSAAREVLDFTTPR